MPTRVSKTVLDLLLGHRTFFCRSHWPSSSDVANAIDEKVCQWLGKVARAALNIVSNHINFAEALDLILIEHSDRVARKYLAQYRDDLGFREPWSFHSSSPSSLKCQKTQVLTYPFWGENYGCNPKIATKADITKTKNILCFCVCHYSHSIVSVLQALM